MNETCSDAGVPVLVPVPVFASDISLNHARLLPSGVNTGTRCRGSAHTHTQLTTQVSNDTCICISVWNQYGTVCVCAGRPRTAVPVFKETAPLSQKHPPNTGTTGTTRAGIRRPNCSTRLAIDPYPTASGTYCCHPCASGEACACKYQEPTT